MTGRNFFRSTAVADGDSKAVSLGSCRVMRISFPGDPIWAVIGISGRYDSVVAGSS